MNTFLALLLGLIGFMPVHADTFVFPDGGGTGTSTDPTTNSILIGNSSGVYDVKTLTAGTGLTLTNSGGTVTLNSTGGSGSVATSTNEVANQIAVFSSNSATPATIAGYAGFKWNPNLSVLTIAGTASTTGAIEAGDKGGVEIYSVGSGVGTLGFNSYGYIAGVSGYGALMQLAPSTGVFSMFTESNVTAGASHGHTVTLQWDSTGLVTIPVGLTTKTFSVFGPGTSTIADGLEVSKIGTQYIVSTSTATSTFAGGINMTGTDCFATQGTCLQTFIQNATAYKQAAIYATAAVLPGTPSYNNGAGGVGATLTEVGFGALVVDGQTVTLGQRILVKNESNQTTNGIYTVSTVGSAIASYVLTRSTDYNSSLDIYAGTTIPVLAGGTVNGDTQWTESTTGTITVGTSNITFIETSVGAAADTFAWPFTSTTNFGALANSTSTPIWFTAGLQASSTSQLAYASTTMISAVTASSTNLIVSSAGGTAGCATFSSTGVLSNLGSSCVTGPPGSDTQIIFNDGGVFGTDSHWTYTKGTRTMFMGTAYISGGTILSGFSLSLKGGDGINGFSGPPGSSPDGGAVLVAAGNPDAGTGGAVKLQGGENTGVGNTGGNILIEPGLGDSGANGTTQICIGRVSAGTGTCLKLDTSAIATTMKTLTFTNNSGTLPLLESSQSWSGTNTFSPAIAINSGGTATTTMYDGGLLFYNSSLATVSQSGTKGDLYWDRVNNKLSVGSTTPWGQVSIASSSFSYRYPLFAVATSSDMAGPLFFITATSSSLISGSSTMSSMYDSGARVSIGTTTYDGYPGLLDQLTVNGRINMEDWSYAQCLAGDAAGSATTCGPFTFVFGTNGAITSASPAGMGYAVFRMTVTAAQTLSGSSLAFKVGAQEAAFAPGTSTPVMETMARIVDQRSAVTAAYYIGFSNWPNTTPSTAPTAGCYFTASSTTQNWQAVCRTSATSVTQVDTGIASSTNKTSTTGGDFFKFRLEQDRNAATFYMASSTAGLRKVAVITSNLASNTLIEPAIGLGATGAGSQVRNLEFLYLKLWFHVPPVLVVP